MVARDLTFSAGPIKMGSPRVQPCFILHVDCADARLSPSSDIWFDVEFPDFAAVTKLVQDVCSEINPSAIPQRSPLSNHAPGGACPSPLATSMKSPRFSLPPTLSSPTVSSAVRFRSPSSSPAASSAPPTKEALADMLSSWSSPTFGFNNQLALPSSPHPRSTETIRLQKSDLLHWRFVGQMDRKFLVTVLSNRYLVAFDQHAVHERILLEELLSKASINPGKMIGLENPVPLNHELANPHLFLPWFRIEHGQLTGCISLHGERLTEQDFQEHVSDVLAGYGHALLPKSVHRVLSFKACRGAIKFGDPVGEELAELLLNELGKCNYPFICAHGRTSFAILSLLF